MRYNDIFTDYDVTSFSPCLYNSILYGGHATRASASYKITGDITYNITCIDETSIFFPFTNRNVFVQLDQCFQCFSGVGDRGINDLIDRSREFKGVLNCLKSYYKKS